MRSHLHRALVVVGLVLLASPASAGQGQITKAQDDVFKKGIEALDDEEWMDAVKYFQDAIRLDPKDSTRKLRGRLGLGGDQYLPHIRLGQAFVGLGDCVAAFKVWEEAERQGIVKDSGDARDIIEEGSDECHDKGFLPSAEFGPQEQKAAALLKDATGIEQDIIAMRAASPEPVAPDAAAAYDRARTELGGARAKLDEARRTRRSQAMTDALAAADTAKGDLTSTRRLFERAIESAVARGAKVRSGIGDVEALIENAARAGQAVSATLAASPVPLSLPADLAQERQRAQASLDGARDKVTAARQSGAEKDLTDARQLAARAQAAFGQIQGEVERLRAAAVEHELERLRTSAPQAFDAANARVSSTQARLTGPGRASAAGGAQQATSELTSARGRLDAARREFDKAAGAGDLAAARTAARTVVAVHDSLDAISPLAGGAAVTPAIPDALKTAAEAYFAGRYDRVAAVLTSDALQSMPASLRVHAHTLRAASLFARYEYSNRREGSLLDAARADADASRRLDPAFQPNPAAFAPKFLAFYTEAAGATR